MFGREAERAQIEVLLDAMQTAPSGLALAGEPGMGKTVVWRAGVAQAQARGYAVLVSAPAAPDAALAFAGLDDLLESVGADVRSALAPARREALNAALGTAETDGGPGARDPATLARAVLALLRELSARGPVLVAIDDEQWLDRATARVLAFALRRLRAEPVGILLARRRDGQGALWPELVGGFGSEGIPLTTIGPLGPRDIARLLADRLDRSLPAAVLRRVHEASAGNPLYALAIASELARVGREGLGDRTLPVPGTLKGALERRLAQLEPRAGQPLLVAAALSGPTLGTIQAVLPGFTLRDLDSAVEGEIVEVSGDRVRFTHPLLASTHYSLAAPARRRALHRMLSESVSDEELRARHLALGAEAPDRMIALLIEQAATKSVRRGAPEAAADLLEQAARLTPDTTLEAKRSRIIAAAEHHTVAGDFTRARGLLESVLDDMPGGPQRARALHVLARLRSDDFALAARLLQEAIDEAGKHDRIAAQCHSQLVEVSLNRGDGDTAGRHSEAALRCAEAAGDPGLLAQILAQRGLEAFFGGAGIQHEVMQRAVALEQEDDGRPTYTRPSTQLGLQLFWSDDLEPARPLLERALRRATERGEENDRAGLLFHLAHLEWEAGRLESARRLTAEVIQSGAQLADAQTDSYVLWLRAFTALRGGDLIDARLRALEAIEVAASLGDHFIASFSGAIVAATELWSSDPAAAHARLSGLRDGLVAGDDGFVGSLTLPFWSLDIEALIALGRLDAAGEVLEHLTGRGQRAGNPNAVGIAHRCAGLLAAARGDIPAAIGAMDAALEDHAQRRLPFELGRTLLETGTLQRRLKRKGDAKRSLELALATLEPLGASLWSARARDELGRIGLRRSAGGDGLTPAQQRVAELVAAGKTNREIAAELFMSLRTVESHLTVVYRRYGVRSRAQLVAAMSASGSAQPTLGAPA